MTDRYEIHNAQGFRLSWPTRDGARMLARELSKDAEPHRVVDTKPPQ